MATIGKSDLIDEIATKASLSKSQARAALEAMTEAVTDHLAKGDKVTLTGFGSFEVRERQARSGVRPGTSERIQIPASRAPAFKAGKNLKDSVS